MEHHFCCPFVTLGDFHFLWECLRVVFNIFWGSPSQPGSLCNLREYIHRVRVSKEVKVFNVGDEFLLYAFKAHLIARLCTVLNVDSTDDPTEHEPTLEWLESIAMATVSDLFYPVASDDPVYLFHRTFLHMGFLYSDLRNAIRFEDGPQIIRHWQLWLPHFLGTGKKNYSVEAANMLVNLKADFPKHIAYIAINNRTVNMEGKPGRGKPLDLLMEHYNL